MNLATFNLAGIEELRGAVQNNFSRVRTLITLGKKLNWLLQGYPRGQLGTLREMTSQVPIR